MATPTPVADEQASTLQITIKDVSGNTTSLHLPPTTTISALKAQLITSPPSSLTIPPSTTPTSLRLVFAGKSLSPTATLADLALPADATLNLMITQRSAAPKKPRCHYKDCKEKAQPIVGDCGFCGEKFCGKHRLLESHECAGLEDCRDAAKERNRETLEGERTLAVKGV